MANDLMSFSLEPIAGLRYSLVLAREERDTYEEAVCKTGAFGPLQILLLRLTPVGGTLLDLGANVGTIAIPMAVAGRRVIAYEALRSNARKLLEAARINQIAERLEVRHRAVWNKRATLRMSGASAWGTVSDAGEEEVDAAAIDDELLPLRVHTVKVDVEGAEYAALQGMTGLMKRDHPNIVFESNGLTMQKHGTSLGEIRRLLETLGYSLYRLFRFKLVPTPPVQEALVCDFLATTIPPAILATVPNFTLDQMTIREIADSILEQAAASDDHKMHTVAVANDLPSAVWDDDRLGQRARNWRTAFAGRALEAYRSAVV